MKNWIKLHLQEVLDKDRLNLLEKIKEIKKLWFYLAWWTGLALLLWHRKSIDFDFFIKWWFNENDLFENLLKIFNWDFGQKYNFVYWDNLIISPDYSRKKFEIMFETTTKNIDMYFENTRQSRHIFKTVYVGV